MKGRITAQFRDREIGLFLHDEEGRIYHTQNDDEAGDSVLAAAAKFLSHHELRFETTEDGVRLTLRVEREEVPPGRPELRVIKGGL